MGGIRCVCKLRFTTYFFQINNIRCKLIGSKIRLSACGFFDTNASLLYKFTGGLLLNLTILLQFGKTFQE